MAIPRITYFLYLTNVVRKREKTFVFRGKTHPYLSPYISFENERIVMDMIALNSGRRILEVGNTLGHHIDFPNDVVDKYEIEEGVINEDVVSFRSEKKYDLFINISTLEHVGCDESPKTGNKKLWAIENLRSLCKPPNGLIMIALPIE